MKMAEQVWLSLGSNVGDKKAYLQFALEKMRQHPQIEIGRKSSIYLAAPWGNKDQDDFYNAVVEIFTDLSPWDLLNFCQEMEIASGRKSLVHWGPRQLDIDILTYGGLQIHTNDLYIPHINLKDRMFVLKPLAEIDADMDLPLAGKVSLMIENCYDKGPVAKIIDADQW